MSLDRLSNEQRESNQLQCSWLEMLLILCNTVHDIVVYSLCICVCVMDLNILFKIMFRDGAEEVGHGF